MILVPCDHCSRHVRADGAACPFCGTEVAEDAASRAVPAAPLRSRLDRVAFFTFATTVAAACSSGGGGGVEGDGGPTQDSAVKDDGGMQAAYGISPVEAGPRDDGGMQGAYGAPPLDSGFDSGGAQPPYGLPPQDAGSE